LCRQYQRNFREKVSGIKKLPPFLTEAFLIFFNPKEEIKHSSSLLQLLHRQVQVLIQVLHKELQELFLS
jgi:hypothetical protein